MAFTGLLNKLATITEKTLTATDRGEATATWSNLAINVPARLYSLSGSAGMVYGKEGIEVIKKVMLDTDETITEQNRIVIDGNTYAIKSINSVDAASESHHKELVVSRVR